MTEGKYKIELNHTGNGRVFLNYWDSWHGRDVVCEIVEDKLMLQLPDIGEHEVEPIEIDFTDFLRRVNLSISHIKE